MIPIRDTIPTHTTPWVTWTLIGLNVLCFAFQLGLSEQELERLFYLFGVVPVRYTRPEWWAWAGLPQSYWPLVTSIFLHGGWAHLIMNMWALWLFGDNVEGKMGSGRFLVFYLLCGLAANACHIYLNADSTIPAVGASGAIAGVMGAYLIMFPTSQIIVLFPVLFLPFFFVVPAGIYLGLWFLMQLLSGGISLAMTQDVGGIAWWAHVGGFAAGVILHRAFVPLKPRPAPAVRKEDWFWEDAWVRRPWR
ncbi:MAG: rhomboid family intramembrane serine protease [Phycisphaerae bacterium]|jgi:membrane associated rhomboid family serine protease|nr:MAG: rhomboid family intramembrane serine protease [Phycisphaerae bacterium]